MGIIKSLLDTDQYIFTMAQAILHQCPGTVAKFKFKCRNGTGVIKDKDGMIAPFLDRLDAEIDDLCKLRFTEEELKYLSGVRYFKKDFIDILRLLQLNRDHIMTYIEDGELQIEIEGPLFLIVWFEVPVLAIISELLCEDKIDFKKGAEVLDFKLAVVRESTMGYNFTFADFGTRRRASHAWHEEVIRKCMGGVKNHFIGTSNLYFAMKYGITPVGTMAHLWFQTWQRMQYRLALSQQAALDAWQKEYRGDLGIALSDIGGFDWFQKDFDLFYAKLFDGCRHDSGDPYWWAEKLIAHYEKLGIDPATKVAVFSDGLDFPKAIDLWKTFSPKIKTSFGIGTNLTNDMGPGYIAPQIVIKMVECNGGPVSKRSDSKGKGMCEDPEFDEYFAKVIAEEIANGTV
jgi:nicotinate phosphoribosyltransferase